MKRLLAALLVVAFVASSFGQTPGPIGGQVTMRLKGKAGDAQQTLGDGDKKVLGLLDLSSEQRSKVQELKKQFFADFLQQKQNLAGDKNGLAQGMRSKLRDYTAGLEQILSPDQMAKYQVWARNRRHLAPTNDRAALESLQLDADLTAKIKQLKSNEQRDAEQALYTNLNNEEAAQKAMERAHDAYLAYLQTALSDQQWKAYQEAMAHPAPKPKGTKKIF